MVMEVVNVGHNATLCSFIRRNTSGVPALPCSMVSTPARVARRIPSGVDAWAATGRPLLFAVSTISVWATVATKRPKRHKKIFGAFCAFLRLRPFPVRLLFDPIRLHLPIKITTFQSQGPRGLRNIPVVFFQFRHNEFALVLSSRFVKSGGTGCIAVRQRKIRGANDPVPDHHDPPLALVSHSPAVPTPRILTHPLHPARSQLLPPPALSRPPHA